MLAVAGNPFIIPTSAVNSNDIGKDSIARNKIISLHENDADLAGHVFSEAKFGEIYSELGLNQNKRINGYAG